MAYDLRHIIELSLDAKIFEDMPDIRPGLDICREAEAILVPTLAAHRFYDEIDEFDFPIEDLTTDPIPAESEVWVEYKFKCELLEDEAPGGTHLLVGSAMRRNEVNGIACYDLYAFYAEVNGIENADGFEVIETLGVSASPIMVRVAQTLPHPSLQYKVIGLVAPNVSAADIARRDLMTHMVAASYIKHDDRFAIKDAGAAALRSLPSWLTSRIAA